MKPNFPSWILIARILRPRGNRGEVAAELLTDFPERLTRIEEVYLSHAGSPTDEPQHMKLQSIWLKRNRTGQAVFHFDGVDSISDAEKFRGCEVLLPVAQRVALPAGNYWVSDLIGCSVFENPSAPPVVSSCPCSLAEAPSLLGTVRDVQFPGERLIGVPLLEVEAANDEVLIPLAEEICKKIDVTARRIDVVLPEGLRALNTG